MPKGEELSDAPADTTEMPSSIPAETTETSSDTPEVTTEHRGTSPLEYFLGETGSTSSEAPSGSPEDTPETPEERIRRRRVGIKVRVASIPEIKDKIRKAFSKKEKASTSPEAKVSPEAAAATAEKAKKRDACAAAIVSVLVVGVLLAAATGVFNKQHEGLPSNPSSGYSQQFNREDKTEGENKDDGENKNENERLSIGVNFAYDDGSGGLINHSEILNDRPDSFDGTYRYDAPVAEGSYTEQDWADGKKESPSAFGPILVMDELIGDVVTVRKDILGATTERAAEDPMFLSYMLANTGALNGIEVDGLSGDLNLQSINQNTQKLANMSPEQRQAMEDKLCQALKDIYEGSIVTSDTIRGEHYISAYAYKDANGNVCIGRRDDCYHAEPFQVYYPTDKDGNNLLDMGETKLNILKAHGLVASDMTLEQAETSGVMKKYCIRGDRNNCGKQMVIQIVDYTENQTPSENIHPIDDDTPPSKDDSDPVPDTKPITPPDDTEKPGDTDIPEKPTEPEKPAPKDTQNLERIDEQIGQDIAKDTHTDTISIDYTDQVSQEDFTKQPAVEEYQGPSATIVQNEDSKKAEDIQAAPTPISPENQYSTDLGGSHAEEYAPVQENQQTQAAADAAETPINQAPTGGNELDDILGNLGIY